MFESIISSGLDLKGFVICIGVALVLGLIVSIIHMKTSKYTKNFVITLSILPALVATVILMVNGNLGTSVAVLGAFGLIRFRSVPGNSREIMNVFFSMAVGLAVGTGYVFFAGIITIILAVYMLFLEKIKFGENSKDNQILKITIPEDLDYTNVFDDVISECLDKCELASVKTINMGSMFEITYYINIKKEINEKYLIDKIRVRNGNLKVILTHNICESEL